MQRIHALRTLALSSTLILALGGTGCAKEEDTGDTGDPPGVEASTSAEASEEEADDEMSPPAEKTDTEASEEE